MLKFLLPFLMMITAAYGQKVGSLAALNPQMCGSAHYRFDAPSKECIYCAHGFKYDENLMCVGTPDVIGKCDGDHHYHPKTNECMFCAKGHAFNETSRKCELQK